MTVSVCISTNSSRGSLFPTLPPAFIVCRFFDCGRCDQHQVVSHCSFDLHFSHDESCCASFHVFLATCISFLEVRGSSAHLLIGLFVFLALSHMSCLYILNINPLSVVSFAIIFSPSEGSLFTLLIVYFAVQKLLSLIRSHLFIFAFISITLEGAS